MHHSSCLPTIVTLSLLAEPGEEGLAVGQSQYRCAGLFQPVRRPVAYLSRYETSSVSIVLGCVSAWELKAFVEASRSQANTGGLRRGSSHEYAPQWPFWWSCLGGGKRGVWCVVLVRGRWSGGGVVEQDWVFSRAVLCLDCDDLWLPRPTPSLRVEVLPPMLLRASVHVT